MFATAFAIIFLGEALTLKFVLGCLFIFLAIYLVNQSSKPRQKERENKTSSLIGEMIKD
jgi:drug/metabolite transporter (DMT)-like permease